MLGSKKITLLFFCVLLFFVLGAGFVFALEVNYPTVPRTTSPQSIPEGSPDALALYVQYIVNFSIWAVGFVAVGIIAIGGFSYLTSTGKPEVMVTARKRISAGFFGLLIILSSWVVLNTINPQFTTFNITGPRAIQGITIPKPPSPFLEIFQSSIDTEIPFGALIEKRIFQKELPEETQDAGSAPDGATDQQEEKPRMERITEIGRNTASLGMLLTLQSMYLQKLVKGEGPGSGDGCTCSNAEPRCTSSCVPESSAFVLPSITGALGLGAITQSISDVIGAGNVNIALGLASNIGNNITGLGGFNEVLGGIQGVANNLQNVEGLSQVFEGVSDITGIVNAVGRPEDLSGIFESLGGLSSLTGSTDLANLVTSIGLPIQGIAQNPTNVSGILGFTNTILGPDILGTGINLGNINGINILGLGGPIQGIIDNPTNISGILGSVNAMLGGGILNTGVNLSNVGGINVLNMGNSIQNIQTSLTNRNIISQAINEISLSVGGPDVSSALLTIDMNESLSRIAASGGNINTILESVNGILATAGGPNLQDIAGVNILNVMSPVQSIIDSSTNINTILGSVNAMIGSGALNTGVNLSNIAGMNILGLGGPIQSIINNPGDISGILNTTNTILGSGALGTGLDLTRFGPEQLNLINIVQPFSSIIQNPASLESFAGALGGFSGAFPNVPGLQDALGNLGGITTLINDPANVGNIMNSAAALANVAPDIQGFNSVLRDIGDIGALMAQVPGLLEGIVTGALCPSCTGDVCSNGDTLPRTAITIAQNQNLKLIQNGGHLLIKTTLNAEQQKAIKEVRLLKEEIGKLERAERFMFECPLGALASLGIFLDSFDSFDKKGWRLENVKFWEEIKSVIKDNDWATFFCPVSGTIWEKKQPKPQQPDQVTPQPEENLGILPEIPTSGLIACTQEAPIGEVIDRAQRLGKKLVERLELLIELDGEMIEAVDRLHQLISQCSAQAPNCTTVCIGTAEVCVELCLPVCGQVCPFDDIEDQIKAIQGVFKKIIPLDEEGYEQGMWGVACTRIPAGQSLSGNPPPESEQESARQGALQDQLPNVENMLQGRQHEGLLGGADICALPFSTPLRQEDIGIIPIIEDNAQRQYVSQVNSLLKDLDDAVRAPMATCTTPPPEKTGITEKKPLSHWLDCGDAVTRVGPDGTLILSCYDEEPAFDDCLDRCYLQGVGEHARYRDSLYRQCLNQCLQTKTQQLGQRDAAIGRHRVNFYCCSL